MIIIVIIIIIIYHFDTDRTEQTKRVITLTIIESQSQYHLQ